jgi:phage-related tail protein
MLAKKYINYNNTVIRLINYKYKVNQKWKELDQNKYSVIKAMNEDNNYLSAFKTTRSNSYSSIAVIDSGKLIQLL